MLNRYDIDAIHFDDYFYPYRVGGVEFPDYLSYAKYGKRNGKRILAQEQCGFCDPYVASYNPGSKKNMQIRYQSIWCLEELFAGYPGQYTQAGQTNYDDLYADILLWLKNGWIDYVVPQLYWEFEQKHAPFGVLLDWWNRNHYDRPCYIGMGYFKAGANEYWRDPTQFPRQLRAIRNHPDVGGEVYFSSTSFDRNPYGWNDTLRRTFYNYPALIAPMPWIDSIRPSIPVIHIKTVNDSLVFRFEKGNFADSLRGYVIYKADGAFNLDSSRAFRLIPNNQNAQLVFSLSSLVKEVNGRYFVTAISKTNNESDPILIYPLTPGSLP